MKIHILFLMFLTGCFNKHVQPPEYLVFKKIQETPYKEDIYDCSNKSGQYVQYLKGKGYNAEYISVRIVIKNESGVSLMGGHAIVKAELKNGSILYCDPTSGEWSTKISDLGEYVGTRTLEELRENPKYFGPTLEEN